MPGLKFNSPPQRWRRCTARCGRRHPEREERRAREGENRELVFVFAGLSFFSLLRCPNRPVNRQRLVRPLLLCQWDLSLYLSLRLDRARGQVKLDRRPNWYKGLGKKKETCLASLSSISDASQSQPSLSLPLFACLQLILKKAARSLASPLFSRMVMANRHLTALRPQYANWFTHCTRRSDSVDRQPRRQTP